MVQAMNIQGLDTAEILHLERGAMRHNSEKQAGDRLKYTLQKKIQILKLENEGDGV